jgi:hypothetical protein
MEKSFLLSTFLKFLHDFCEFSVFQREPECAGHMTAKHTVQPHNKVLPPIQYVTILKVKKLFLEFFRDGTKLG